MKAFNRAFPLRNVYRGRSLGAVLLFALTSFLLTIQLFILFLIIDLLYSGGNLYLDSVEELARIQTMTAQNDLKVARFEEAGIIHTVWWSRDHFWNGLISYLYVHFTGLQTNQSAIFYLIITAVLIGFVQSLCYSQARRMISSTALNVTSTLRQSLHYQALKLRPGNLTDSDDNSVLNLFLKDIELLRTGLSNWLERIGRDPIRIVFLLIFIFSINPRTAFQCMIPIIACWYLVQKELVRYRMAKNLELDQSRMELKFLSESFLKTRIVRGFNMENIEHQNFRNHLQRYRNNILSVSGKERMSRWINRMLVMISSAIVLYLLGSKILANPDELSLASGITFVLSIICLNPPMESLWKMKEDQKEAILAADRIYRYLDRMPEVTQAVNAKFIQPVSETVRFQSVDYKDPVTGNILLNKFDVEIEAGKVTSVISMNPLEARAFAYMLPRFIEPQNGKILFDGDDTLMGTLESIRAETIFVSGNSPYFTGTVIENIACGNPKYALPEITEAAKKTHAHNFILKLPQGYETVLGEHGEQLTESQSFRLGLTRAILRDPAILLIEEPRIKLDEDTKSLLDDAYNRISPKRTIIFFPTRLSTLRRADKIIFIRNGKLEACEPYDKLVKTSSAYRHWEYTRYNQFG